MTAASTNESATFTSTGGLTIFEQWWAPPGDPRAVVAICHGYAEHSGRYAEVAEYLVERGYRVEALDLRGHGRSEGERVGVDRYDDFLDDLDGFLERVRERNPGRRVFLLGHSMGGGVVASYLVARKPELAGVVFSGPGVPGGRPAPKPGEQPRTGPLPANAISRDPAVVAAYENDPLVHRGPRNPKLMDAMAASRERLLEGVGTITLPMLVLHGTEDLLVPWQAGQWLHDNAGSADKKLKLYDGLYHEVLNDPERLEVLADLAAWLGARS